MSQRNEHNLPKYARRTSQIQTISDNDGRYKICAYSIYNHFGLNCNQNIQVDMEMNYVLNYCNKVELPLKYVVKSCVKHG